MFLACFVHFFILKLYLKIIASEASDTKWRKKQRFGHTKIIGPRPLGEDAGCAPPGSASVKCPPNLFMFYDNAILLYTFDKCRLNLNARSCYCQKCVKSCKQDAFLTPAVNRESYNFPPNS